jgi:predicted nucleic acid-binding protein
MSKARLFLDSSALIAGVISPVGGARALLVLAETGVISIIVSEQVIAESERAIAKKAPRTLDNYRKAVKISVDQILRDPNISEIKKHQGVIKHRVDVPILVAAMNGEVDFLVTLNRKHFIDDPGVARKSGLKIGTPGDALEWLRQSDLLKDRS